MAGMCAVVHVWRSKDCLGELSYSFHHVSPSYQTQIVRLAYKHLLPLSHLAEPKVIMILGTNMITLVNE